MPSPSSARLASSYHDKQVELANAAAKIIIGAWRQSMQDRTLRVTPTREAADRWLALSLPTIEAGAKKSARLGQSFYVANRRLEVPDSPTMRLPGLPTFDKKAVTSSLWFVGPREYVDAGKAVDDIFTPEKITEIEGAVARHVQNGGRQAIDAAYDRDPLAVGYYRIEDGDPCHFCAMLMSRGIVYKEDSFDESDPRFFGPGEAKVHDHCGGGLAPAYDRNEKYPADAAKYWDMWGDLTGRDRAGRPIDPAKEFRQRFEGRY